MRAATRARAALTLLLLFGFLGCSSTPHRPALSSYTVRPGDTLYSISWRHGLDYHEVARQNGIGGDYRIAVGQVLKLATSAGAPAAPVARSREADAARPLPALPVTPPPHWLWPADGMPGATVHQPAGGLGLEIDGAPGAEVRAAAAGRVVYTGTGLRGYGSLVIIKHDEAWLTAYGYNRDVAVTEGESVRAGQRIATMGEGPTRRAQLYFEIRLNGRPVDPAAQLPPRH